MVHPFNPADTRGIYRIEKDPGKVADSAGLQQRGCLIDDIIGRHEKLVRLFCFFHYFNGVFM